MTSNIQHYQKSITRSFELHYEGWFSCCLGSQLNKQLLLWFHVRINQVPFRFASVVGEELSIGLPCSKNLLNKCSRHEAFPKNLLKVCFVIHTQISSNIAK